METTFKRELKYSYMNLTSSEAVDEASFELKILASNQISGILAPVFLPLNNQLILQYNITSLIPLTTLIDTHRLHEKELRILLLSLISTLLQTEDYLLNANCLLIDLPHIMISRDLTQIYLAYVPFLNKDPKLALKEFVEQLLKAIPQNDRRANLLLCRMLHELQRQNLNLPDIRLALCEDEASHTMENDEQEALFSSAPMPNAAKPLPQKPRRTKASKIGNDSLVQEEAAPATPKQAHKKKILPILLFILSLLLLLSDGILFYFSLLPLYAVFALAILGICIAAIGLFLLLPKPHRQAKNLKPTDDLTIPDPSPKEPTMPDHSFDTSLLPNPTDFFEQEDGCETVLLDSPLFPPSEPVYPALIAISDSPKETAKQENLIISKPDMMIGSQSSSVDLLIASPYVSRIHARIFKREDVYYLTDLSSKNGTLVDDRPLSPHEEVALNEGSIVTFADCIYQFTLHFSDDS